MLWNMNLMTFHSVGNVIIPTDELIFSEGLAYHQPIMFVAEKTMVYGRYNELVHWGYNGL